MPLLVVANNDLTVDKRPKGRVKEMFPKCFINEECGLRGHEVNVLWHGPYKSCKRSVCKVQVADLPL